MSFAIDRKTFLSLVATLAACAQPAARPSEGPAPPRSASTVARTPDTPPAPSSSAPPAASAPPLDAGATDASAPQAAEDLLGFDGDTIDHLDVPACARFSWWSCDEVTPPALRCALAWKRLPEARRGAYAECLRAAPTWPSRGAPAACADHTCSRLHTAASRASGRLEECAASSNEPHRDCAAEARVADDAALRARGCAKRAKCGEDLASCVEQSRYLEACERAKASR